MAVTITALMTSVQGDGGNVGKAVTTPASGIVAGDYLLVCELGAANADAMTPPAGWSTISLPDTSIATGGGAIQAWWLKNPAASTTYAWTSSSGRASIIGLLVHGADPTTFINIASSLQSVPGTNHTPPAITTTVNGCKIIGFAGLRQFSPDVANWTVPSGWTEEADIQGADGNNNCRLAAGSIDQAVAGAVGTTAWTNTDVFEESIIIYIAIQPAAGGGTDVTVADSPVGYRWQSTGGVVAAGVVVGDTSRGGYRWNSASGPGVTVGVTAQDVPGGWRWQSTGGQAVLGVTTSDQAGPGFRLGASRATGDAASVVADTAPLGLRWRSADGLGATWGVTVPDSPSGWRLGVSQGAVSAGVVVPDTPNGLRWLSGASGVTIGAPSDVLVSDLARGWLRFGESQASVIVGVPPTEDPDFIAVVSIDRFTGQVLACDFVGVVIVERLSGVVPEYNFIGVVPDDFA